MKLHNLKPAAGSKGREKRIGRGEGSGHGGTSTRGHKGAKARSGYSRKIGFEGGQMPIQRRLPKFGFTNPNRVEYKAINVSVIQALAEKLGTEVIGLDTLREAGFVSKNQLVKILGKGELTAKVQISANAFSKSAVSKIEAAVLSALEQTPPELYADLVRNGIYLAGGGALLRGLDKRLTDKIGITFHIADDPLHAVAKGTGVALKNVDKFNFLIR